MVQDEALVDLLYHAASGINLYKKYILFHQSWNILFFLLEIKLPVYSMW